jgi:hypothetical protein
MAKRKSNKPKKKGLAKIFKFPKKKRQGAKLNRKMRIKLL